MLFDILWAFSLLGISLSGYGWLSSRFAISALGTFTTSLLGLTIPSLTGSRSLKISELALSGTVGYFAPQWSISSYLDILYYLRPVLIIVESLVFAAAIDKSCLALKAKIDSNWARIVTLSASFLSLLVGVILFYDAFTSDPIPTLAAAGLGALVCAQTGTLVAFGMTNRGMILNWTIHVLLTNWQASQALADWRVYTAQGTYHERSLHAVTASLVTTLAIFLMPLVMFWTPDHQVFGKKTIVEKWGQKTRGESSDDGVISMITKRPTYWWAPTLLQVLYTFSILSTTGEIRSDGGMWRGIQCILSMGLYVVYLARDESSREV